MTLYLTSSLQKPKRKYACNTNNVSLDAMKKISIYILCTIAGITLMLSVLAAFSFHDSQKFTNNHLDQVKQSANTVISSPLTEDAILSGNDNALIPAAVEQHTQEGGTGHGIFPEFDISIIPTRCLSLNTSHRPGFRHQHAILRTMRKLE